ncbi:hypothetical protein DMUE_6337, partial [Dictyocoela muelleri]
TSVYNAMSKVFPEVEIRGCNFHFNQIVVRFMIENKIIENYKNDLTFRKFVKYLLSLAYVPKQSVESEYKKINNIKKNKYEYNLINDFFAKNFIYNNMKIKNKNFWSAYSRIINNLPTTTNSCEAYHKHLNSKVNKKNSALAKIIDLLKREEVRIRIMIQNIKSGLMRYKRKENILQSIVVNYELYDNFEFYDNVANIIDLYIK